MRSLATYFLLFSLAFLQSCGTDDDEDCSATICDAGYADLNFQIIDSNTGENIFDNIASSEGITVVETSNDLEADFQVIENNEQKTLVIYTFNDAEFSVMYADEEIFTVSVEGEAITEGCCPTIAITDLSIEGAEYMYDEMNDIHVIERSVRPHLATDESLENYHAFFENSRLQIDALPDSNDLEMDVKPGNNLVFKLLQYEDPIPEAIDDEITRIVYFEVDANANSFLINSDNFSEYKVVTGISGSISNITYVEQGEIVGEKLNDNEWKISLNTSAVTETDININVDQTETIFTKSTYEDVWMPIYYTHLFY
ncbi:hypothetical protein [uncultured Christiangramia sp.]|uniref:hypothetical protein n=1 Tax=uncultured Christiangramia sp. TaxID=503836 RepID=UPI0026233C32|nr:hypothetical protein [uncultured Christiangramia sp.]